MYQTGGMWISTTAVHPIRIRVLRSLFHAQQRWGHCHSPVQWGQGNSKNRLWCPPSTAFFSISQIVAAVQLVCSVSLLVSHRGDFGSSVSAVIHIFLYLERCYCCKIPVPVLVHLFDMYLQDFDMMWIIFWMIQRRGSWWPVFGLSVSWCYVGANWEKVSTVEPVERPPKWETAPLLDHCFRNLFFIFVYKDCPSFKTTVLETFSSFLYKDHPSFKTTVSETFSLYFYGRTTPVLKPLLPDLKSDLKREVPLYIFVWAFLLCSQDIEYAIEGYFTVAKSFTDSDDLEVAGGITIKQYREMYAERVGKAVSLTVQGRTRVLHAFWAFLIPLLQMLCMGGQWIDGHSSLRFSSSLCGKPD